MKDKIFEEALEWYESHGKSSDVNIKEFVDLVIDKTASELFHNLKDELRNEFDNGNLKHNFIISSDYYLELKLKEIKDKYLKNLKRDLPEVDEEI